MLSYIENIIDNINNNKIKLRKATLNDFELNNNYIKQSINNFRVQKNQTEHGHKKFIKP